MSSLSNGRTRSQLLPPQIALCEIRIRSGKFKFQIHGTDGCIKKLEEPVKCANCGQKHTANYKGCQIFRKIFSRTYSKTKTTKIAMQHIQTSAVPPAEWA